LFDQEDGAQLCWLCSSRRKVQAAEADPDPADKEYEDRRAWKRYPVQIHMKFYYGETEKSKVIFPGTTVNISRGGLCVEWTPCDECEGYDAGGIDDNCIFAHYDASRENAASLYVTLFLADDDVVNLTAQAVFVMKQQSGTEYVGFSFTDLDKFTQERVDAVIDQVTTDG
jgi:hypothetical protein